MKLIIDIPDYLYNFVKTKRINGIYHVFDSYDAIEMSKYVRKGTPLEEELKTIRVKITACTAQGEGNFCDIHNNAIEMARKVVDNRISELKGK